MDPLASWPAFAEQVRERLEAGRQAYGDKSFSREPAELVHELQLEALDLAGWGFVLYQRLEAMREQLAADPSSLPKPPSPDVFQLPKATVKRIRSNATAALCAELQPEEWLQLERLNPLLKNELLRQAGQLLLRRSARRREKGGFVGR